MVSGGLVYHYFPTTISYLSLLGTYIAANTKECTNFRANWFVGFGNKSLTSSITFAFGAKMLLTLLSATCVFKSRVQKTDLSLLTELYLIPYRRRRAAFKISKGIRDTRLFHYDALWHVLKKLCDV